MKYFMYIFAVISIICFIAGCFEGYRHCYATSILSGLIAFIIWISIQNPIINKCPYQKVKCTIPEDSHLNCKDCPNYNNGIIVSKF